MTSSDCIFCKIASGTAAARILHQDAEITAFHDIHPLAPVHVLVIPNRHIDSANDLTTKDQALLGKMILTASRLAGELGVAQSGYRLFINTGRDGGQTVQHLHLHLVGGRKISFGLSH